MDSEKVKLSLNNPMETHGIPEITTNGEGPIGEESKRSRRIRTKNIHTESTKIMPEIGLNFTDKEILQLNKNEWVNLIEKRLKETADSEAQKECGQIKKTREMSQDRRI